MHVCSLWRQLILSTPEFWVSMVEGSFAQPIWKGPQEQEDSSVFFTFIRRTAPRLYSLPLRARNFPLLQQIPQDDISRLVGLRIHPCPDMSMLLSLGLSAVERIVIVDHHIVRVRESRLEMGLSAPRSSQFPKLVELTIPSALFLPALAVPSLRRLTVSGEIRDPDVFQRALRECGTHLEHLSFYDCPLLSLLLTTPLQPVVHLPRLSTLVAHGAYPSSGNPVSRLLTYPTSTRVYLSFYGYYQALRDIFPSQGGRYSSRTGHPVDRLVCNCTIQPGRSRWEPFPTMTLAVRGYVQETETIAVSVEPSPWSSSRGSTFCGPSIVLPDVVGVFSESRISLTHLVFVFHHPIAVTKDDWMLVLHSFPCITSLSVRIKSCLNLVRALREGGVCSALECLSIQHANGTGIHELFVATIEARAARGHPRLLRLAFRASQGPTEGGNLSRARIARLQAVVDEVVLDEPSPPV